MSENDPNDLTLLHQYAENGSSAAFAQVVARHADFVFATALRQTRSHELAEDVTQAAFIVLARRARSLRDGASVAAFLHQTTMFAAKNALRAESRRRRHEKQAAIDPAVPLSSKQDAPLDDGAIAVDCALARLRDGDRQFLMLHYFDGLNVDDLAAKLKISHEAARKRLHRALGRLRAHLTHAGRASTTAAVPTIIAALAHPGASIDASAVASTAVAGGVDGRAFALAHRMLLKIKLLMLSKAIVATAAVAIVAGSAAIAIQQVNHSNAGTIPPRPLASDTSRPATSAPAGAPTVVDYPRVFSDMRETRDERARLESMLKDNEAEASKRQAEINQLRADRDATQKDSPEYARLDQSFKKATVAWANDSRTLQKNHQCEQVQMMGTLYQKIEVAVAAIGATHHLQLSPPAKPAYPARADLISVQGLRILCNKRAIPRPDGAPDLTQEVIDYLDSHAVLQVPGIPLPPNATTAPSASPPNLPAPK